MLIDEPELHREADPKMSAAFFKMSRSIRSRSFLRRRRATSETRSDDDGGGLTPKQVQGIRMRSSREINRRRAEAAQSKAWAPRAFRITLEPSGVVRPKVEGTAQP